MAIAASNKAVADSIAPQRHSFVAAQLCQELKMDEAIAEIEKAIADQDEANDMYTWYVRGFIYKEKYKIELEQDIKNSSRDIAVASFLKSEQMAGKETQTTLNHNAALKYLASTYYNDALILSGQLQTADDVQSDSYLIKYHDLIRTIEPDHNFINEDKVYYTAKGQRLYSLWIAQTDNNQLFQACKTAFDKTLELDPTDCSSQYNLAVLLHNRVTNHFKNNSGTALDKCCQTGDALCPEAKEYAKQALELCEQAYKACPSNETKQALNVCRKTLGLAPVEEIKN
jgi:hypothetical protein